MSKRGRTPAAGAGAWSAYQPLLTEQHFQRMQRAESGSGGGEHAPRPKEADTNASAVVYETEVEEEDEDEDAERARDMDVWTHVRVREAVRSVLAASFFITFVCAVTLVVLMLIVRAPLLPVLLVFPSYGAGLLVPSLGAFLLAFVVEGALSALPVAVCSVVALVMTTFDVYGAVTVGWWLWRAYFGPALPAAVAKEFSTPGHIFLAPVYVVLIALDLFNLLQYWHLLTMPGRLRHLWARLHPGWSAKAR